MGAPGPPGPFDLQKFFRAPPQSPYQPQSPGYQPSSPGSPFHHQHSSYPPGNSAPSNYQQNTSGYSNVQGSNYPYNTTTPQQSGSPVYHGTHGPQYMHYTPEHRQVPYSASPFSQQSSQFSQPPSSPSHSIQPPPSPTMSSIPMSSQPLFSQPKSSQPPSPLPASSLQQGNDRPNTASSQPLDGARLIALLSTQSGGEAVDDDEDTLPLPGPPQSSPRPPLSLRHTDGSHSSGGDVGCPPPPMASSGPGRPPSKYPRGRHLRGDHIIYDVDVRKPGEAHQLEVSPITVYGSENVLVLGRQISVNKKFVCYGLRGGPIRILKINSAQKALLRGHTQRLNDMSFSENVHMLASASQDGRIYVRKILEGNSEDGKVLEHILLALRLVGDWETCHPRLCWHSHLQDTLIVAIGRFIVTINVSKAGQGVIPGGFNGEHPLECRLDSPVKGVYVVGEHEEEVTALAYPLAGPPRLASASKDGTVRIWGDKMQCLSEIRRAHDGGSVDAVAYLSTPRSLDRHILLTAGPLNRELKLWMSEELSSKSSPGGWRCIQTLEFQSSSKPETAFFNHVVVAHRAGLILVANAKRNAIYAIRVDFGPVSAAPRMEYLAEFAVTMPILSVTVADDAISENGEGILKIYCVQTHAIQQYTLDMSQCLPPADDLHSEGSTPNTPKKSLIVPQAPGTPTSTAFAALDKNYPSLMTMANPGVSASTMSANTGIPPRPSAVGSLVESRGQLHVSTEANKISETKFSTVPLSRDSRDGPGSKPTTPGGHANSEAGVQSNSRQNTRPEVSREGLSSSNLTKPPTPPPRRRARSRSPAKAEIQYNPVYPVLSRHKVEKEEVKDIWPDPEPAAAVEASLSSSSSSSVDESCDKEDREGANSANFQHQSGPQLITPSEIMSLAASSKRDGSQIQGTGLDPMDGTDWQEEEKSSMSGGGKPGINVTDNVPGGSESLLEAADDASNGHHATGVDSVEKEMMAHNDVWSSPGLNDDVQDSDNMEDREQPNPDDLQEQLKGMALKLGQANASLPVMQFQTSATLKGRKSKNKNGDRASANIPLPTSSQLATMPSGTMSEGEAGSPTPAHLEVGLITQVISMQESLNQLVTVQKELQKQITVMVAVPVSKEGKRLEGALGQRMEKVLKANVDAVWARLAEESAKREKQERERMQQVTSLLTNFMSKDIPVALERGLKKEIAAIGPAVAQSIAAPIQKSVSTAVSETFQKSVVEKVLPQLEKSTISKLEATMTKQLMTQFQTTGRQALQEALRSGFENLVIPAFEQSCRHMFEQVDSSFQMGMAEHTANTQQQFESSHNALASNLQQAIEGASTLAKTLNDELLDSTGKLLEIVELAGANVSRNVAEVNQSKGTLPEKVHSLQHVEETLDPTIELRRLLQEGKWEEAFNKALSANDPQVVSWLCHQVEPSTILSGTSPRVSQGVLLWLVLQLSSELAKDTGHKLQWIKEAALALNPDDPHLGPHMRQYLEQAYQNCHCLMGVTTNPSEQANLRLVIHVMNSLMSSCK